MSDTVTFNVELTDTFGGQANYAWVKRYQLTVPAGLSDRAIIMRARALCGLTGVRGRLDSFGGSWDFRPYGACMVMFVMTNY